MTLLPDLEAQLRDAAHRTHPRSAAAHARRALRPRRRTLVIALAVALLLASVAAAAITISTRTGDPAPKVTGLGSPYNGPGRILPGQDLTPAATTPDPDGGLPWGVRSYVASRQAACWQAGRVLHQQLGVLGRDGLLHDDGLFHPLAPQVDQCRSLDGAGHLFAFQNMLALDNGVQSRMTCRPKTFGNDPGRANLPVCPDGSARLLLYGFLGPQARSVTLKLPGGAQPQTHGAGRGGAFIFAIKLDDPAQALRYDLRATYADGSTRAVADGPTVESAPRLGPVPEPPPGYVDPLRDLAAPSRVRTPLHVTHRRLGKNTIYTIRFRAPVAIHRFGVEYSLVVDGPGAGKDCGDPLRFQGFNTQDDVRAGKPMTIKLTPAIAGRWNRGWCPGRYRAAVILHDRRHPVGSFGFVAP